MLVAIEILLHQNLGIQDVMTYSIFVGHDGVDLINCGNWTMPCRTVRYAVKMSNDGDQIYIDYAQGKPYMECQNVTQSEPWLCTSDPIEVTTSISFHGVNGNAEIQCHKSCKLFKITNSRFYPTQIKFFNLVISRSDVIAELNRGARSTEERDQQ